MTRQIAVLGALLSGVLGVGLAAAGCSSGDSTVDAGDAGGDGTVEASAAGDAGDARNAGDGDSGSIGDVHNAMDSSDAADGSDSSRAADAFVSSDGGPNAFVQYAAQHGQAYCLGLGKCCTGYDAGAFNQAACANAWRTTGWEYTLPANNAIYNRGNLTLNPDAGAACITALQGFACTPPSGAPLTTAAAYGAVTTACQGVLTGTIATGTGGCLSSFECANGYCALPTDGGTGTCTALVGSGAMCVPGNDSPDQMCSRAGAYVPMLWCNRLDGGATGTCAAPFADTVPCFNATTGYWDDYGCTSLMCGDIGCGGTTTYPLAGFCANWAPADAGGGG